MGPAELTSRSTPIPGLVLFGLPVHGDHRGWFKENWHRRKMMALGLPDFGPVQNNISFNAKSRALTQVHPRTKDPP